MVPYGGSYPSIRLDSWSWDETLEYPLVICCSLLLNMVPLENADFPMLVYKRVRSFETHITTRVWTGHLCSSYRHRISHVVDTHFWTCSTDYLPTTYNYSICRICFLVLVDAIHHVFKKLATFLSTPSPRPWCSALALAMWQVCKWMPQGL